MNVESDADAYGQCHTVTLATYGRATAHGHAARQSAL
jgi:hypothetical protein